MKPVWPQWTHFKLEIEDCFKVRVFNDLFLMGPSVFYIQVTIKYSLHEPVRGDV